MTEAGAEKSLAEKMREAGKPELVELADKLDAATAGYFAKPQTHSVQQMLGAWARARRAWCEHSGEPLI